ncbi:MAG: DUF1684 domain-containing protein [Chloroflexota bacterium]
MTPLDLADWRRQVADLYAEVRRLLPIDPVAAHSYWCNTRERLYREHPVSPIPLGARASFRARHFPYAPAWRFEARVVAVAPHDVPDGAGRTGATAGDNPTETPSVSVTVSTGGAMDVRQIGWLDIPFPGGERRLALYWLPGYAGGLFLPFRDATNGAETYGGGRYLLDAAKSADLGGDLRRKTLLLDFNFAYQPSCAFDAYWTCPLSPPANRLDLAVRAGEQIGVPC